MIKNNFVILAILTLLVFGCKSKETQKEDIENSSDVPIIQDENIQKTIDLGDGLNDKLKSLILDYSKEYPIKEIGKEDKAVHQSYYVSFFKVNDDSLLAICRQPFVFDLFPDFAFSSNEIPEKKPIPVGILKGSDLPIIVFDVEDNIGERFYNRSFLNSEIPELYYAKDEVSHDTIIPPIFKYKIDGEDFILLGKSKNQRID